MTLQAIIGKKIGMTQLFEGEQVIPVTVIEAGPCTVVQRKTIENDGYEAMQMSFGERNKKRMNKPLLGHFKKAGDILVGSVIKEFRLEKDDEVKPGQVFTVSLFQPGDHLTICGKSLGKGFSGTVRRHHFGRGPMAHGSKSHRLPGSIGAGTSPGHVLKGTRMAGRLGGGRATIRHVKLVRVDGERNLLFVKGAVPGHTHAVVTLQKESRKGTVK